MVYCFGYWCGDMHTLLSETVGENFILTFEQMNNDIMFTQETTDDRKWSIESQGKGIVLN